jgi:hypothetical protein
MNNKRKMKKKKVHAINPQIRQYYSICKSKFGLMVREHKNIVSCFQEAESPCN